MSMNSTPSSHRIHIGIFGKRNAGKSSLINALTGQDLAIVSDIAGTTTDPVSKSMELLPLGPVILTDTPGLDDTGILGDMRTQKGYRILNKTDIALIVIDSEKGITAADRKIEEAVIKKNIPYLMVMNKCDTSNSISEDENTIYVSARKGTNINKLKEKIGTLLKIDKNIPIVSDILEENDVVVLVIPIDSSAPKGRIILPQQQVIRDILEGGAVSVITDPEHLLKTLELTGKRTRMVITDSQVFSSVSKIVPDNILLTSFSILMAKFKNNLEQCVIGASYIDKLKDGDTVLISEGCTHHRQCEDIGTVKLPSWIKKYTNKNINFEFTSGGEFPDELNKYDLIIHCGGCMLNEREMKYRYSQAKSCAVPMTNYGTAIAFINGILKRTVAPFKEISELL